MRLLHLWTQHLLLLLLLLLLLVLWLVLKHLRLLLLLDGGVDRLVVLVHRGEDCSGQGNQGSLVSLLLLLLSVQLVQGRLHLPKVGRGVPVDQVRAAAGGGVTHFCGMWKILLGHIILGNAFFHSWFLAFSVWLKKHAQTTGCLCLKNDFKLERRMSYSEGYLKHEQGKVQRLKRRRRMEIKARLIKCTIRKNLISDAINRDTDSWLEYLFPIWYM